jgi:hypothetical protein
LWVISKNPCATSDPKVRRPLPNFRNDFIAFLISEGDAEPFGGAIVVLSIGQVFRKSRRS